METLLSSASYVLAARRALMRAPSDNTEGSSSPEQDCADIATRALRSHETSFDESQAQTQARTQSDSGSRIPRRRNSSYDHSFYSYDSMTQRRESRATTIVPALQTAPEKSSLYPPSHSSAGDTNPPPGSADPDHKTSIHPVALAELTLYSTEISHALRVSSACKALQAHGRDGQPASLAAEIRAARVGALGAAAGTDLGLIRVLQRAQEHLDGFGATQAALCRAMQCFDVGVLEGALAEARAAQLTRGELFAAVEARAAELRRFELTVQGIKNGLGGALTDIDAFLEVLKAAAAAAPSSDGPPGPLAHPGAPLVAHPLCIAARTAALLSPHALRTTLIAEACAANLPYVAATETMRAKRVYLSQPGIQALFALETFPHLRSMERAAEASKAVNAASRDPLQATSSRGSIIGSAANVNGLSAAGPDLLHSSASIPVSLTVQPAAYSALAVWIFAHCVQGIEMEIYTRPEVNVRLAIRCGQACPGMRDEILLQIIKQIRNNPEAMQATAAEVARGAGRVLRLWVLLCTCLRHFPPSAAFENYLELFLYMNLRSAELYERPNVTGPHFSAGRGGGGIHHGWAEKAAPTPRGRSGFGGHGGHGSYSPGAGAGRYDRTQLAKLAIRLMHEAVFTFGYGVPIEGHGHVDPNHDPATNATPKSTRNPRHDLSLSIYPYTAWLGPARAALVENTSVLPSHLGLLSLHYAAMGPGAGPGAGAGARPRAGAGTGTSAGSGSGHEDTSSGLTGMSYLYDPGFWDSGPRVRPPEEEVASTRQVPINPGGLEAYTSIGQVP